MPIIITNEPSNLRVVWPAFREWLEFETEVVGYVEDEMCDLK